MQLNVNESVSEFETFFFNDIIGNFKKINGNTNVSIEKLIEDINRISLEKKVNI